MRALTIFLPLMLLAGGGLLVFRGEERLVLDRGVVELPRVVEVAEVADVVWVSHDWVEVVVPEGLPRELARRELFGMDPSGNGVPCALPNCRACLIDFVYGREF